MLCFGCCRHVTIGKTGAVYFMEWAEWHPVFILSLLCELKTDSSQGQLVKCLFSRQGQLATQKRNVMVIGGVFIRFNFSRNFLVSRSSLIT